MDSPSPLSLDRTGDLLCSKLESSFNYKLRQPKSSEKYICGITTSNSSISAGMRPGLNKSKQFKMYGGLENVILNIRLKIEVVCICLLLILHYKYVHNGSGVQVFPCTENYCVTIKTIYTDTTYALKSYACTLF